MMITEIEDRTKEAEALLDKSETVLHEGNVADGIALAKQGLAIHELLGNKSGAGRAHNILGIVAMNAGSFDSAFEHYRFALDVSLELDHRGRVASTLHNIGMIHHQTGNNPEALDHLYRAQKINEEIGELRHLGHNLVATGSVLLGMGEHTMAIEAFEKSLELYQKLEHASDVASSLSSIGTSYEHAGDNERALDFYLRAEDIYKSNLNEPHTIENFMSLARCLIKLNRLEEALAYTQRVEALEIDRPVNRIGLYDLLATIDITNGDLNSALKHYQRALECSQTFGLRYLEVQLHLHMRDLALKRSDLPSYVTHNDRYNKIKEEIQGTEASIRIAVRSKEREFETRETEYQKHLAVLHSTLPKDIADRVARGEVVNDHFENASVLFLDIVGFTSLSADMNSGDVISMLDDIFSQCDAICARHNVTKIKTIGDSYMAADFGLASSEQRIANSALEMMKIELKELSTMPRVEFRIGIHCGPVTAGVIGKDRLQYDVWGDTVNIASRMESTGESGRIHVSETFRQRCDFVFIPRETIEIKGRGPMQTYWLTE